MEDVLLFDAETIPELEKDAAWWTIYEESIPASERESKAVIFRGMERKVAKALRARHNGKTVGMANIHLCHHPGVVFLGLLAIAPAEREHHIGGELFEYAFANGCDALVEHGSVPLGMVWEVDDPLRSDDPEEKKTRERRISFYEHHDGHVLPCKYILPPLTSGNSPQPMRLMFRPCEEGFSPDEKTMRDMIWAMYFEKYCAVNGIDESALHTLMTEIDGK